MCFYAKLRFDMNLDNLTIEKSHIIKKHNLPLAQKVV